MKKIFFIIALAFILMACGQTGKLYLPDKTAESSAKP